MTFSNPLVGGGGALVRPEIRSPDYVTGVSGWSLRRDGSAEFTGGLTSVGNLYTGTGPPRVELGPDVVENGADASIRFNLLDQAWQEPTIQGLLLSPAGPRVLIVRGPAGPFGTMGTRIDLYETGWAVHIACWSGPDPADMGEHVFTPTGATIDGDLDVTGPYRLQGQAASVLTQSGEVPSTALLMLSTVQTLVPGTTKAFTTYTDNALLFVTAYFEMDVNASGNNLMVGELVVDGATQARQARSESNNGTVPNQQRDTVGMSWRVPVATAGAHSMHLTGRATGALGSQQFNPTHTGYTWQLFESGP